MTSIDLGPATTQLAALVRGVPDDRLGGPTPCADYAVGDLLDHIAGLAEAFTLAAAKATVGRTGAPPLGDAARLGDDWRRRIPAAVEGLAVAWRDPEAWTGMTSAGGVDLPGEVGGLVALEEVVVHGWDLARATGQPFAADDDTLHAVRSLVAQFSGPGSEEQRAGGFGPEVAVPADAPLLDQVLGMVGRDASWAPPAASAV